MNFHYTESRAGLASINLDLVSIVFLVNSFGKDAQKNGIEVYFTREESPLTIEATDENRAVFGIPLDLILKRH